MMASIRSNLPCYPVMMVPGDDNNFMPNQPTGGADPQSELILQISHFPILIDSQAANSTTVQTNKVHCFMPTTSCSDVMRSVHCFLFIILVFLSKQVLPCSTQPPFVHLYFFRFRTYFRHNKVKMTTSKVCVVTGASYGLGSHIAKQLGECRCQLCLLLPLFVAYYS